MLARSLLGLIVLASPSLAIAQTVVTLTDDVYLQWRSGNDPHGKFGVCGFMIVGNHLSRKNPKVVWDINIDEVWKDKERVAGYSAGSFDVVDGKRKPRSPITELTFLLEGQSEPIPTQIFERNADNGVRGKIELDRAQFLFDALSEEKWITITLKYADSTSEVLKTRGYHDEYHGGRSSPFNMCLAGKTPYGNLRRPVY
jgi:hypothetical protein